MKRLSFSKHILTAAFALGAALFSLTPHTVHAQIAADKAPTTYALHPDSTLQRFDGWGVSLCWWANMCGRWDEAKVDTIVNWLVSPDGLNNRLFRYNIGGGEDPENSACERHHMGRGKGLRAEMEGFKDSTADAYHWERDAAQRKIMLKIKERRPDAVFEAFSNSCPYYMTVSGCVGGNKDGMKDNLRRDCYEEFAQYLVDVCLHYKSLGIEFHTLEPFNEAMSGYWYAGGSQEGCHFDKESQVDFLRILSPILKQSGLRTVISASDETSVAQSVEAFEYYKANGALGLIGQWNTHTYIATDSARRRLQALTSEAGIPLWMSEVGSGGKGIEGNLRLAQTLITDMRLLKPAAWFDWQYMEERSDQWCTIQGSFADATFRRVKNFNVRRQFTNFIREGYTLLSTPDAHALAALSADGRTLTLVLLNGSREAAARTVGLSAFGRIKTSAVKAWRTSDAEDVAPVSDFRVKKHRLLYTLPPLSVTSFVIEVGR